MSTTRKLILNFPISADAYLHEMYFTAEYARGLYMDGLGFSVCDQLRFEQNASGRIERTLRLCPTMNAPKPVQKVLGETQQYDEIGTFDPSTRTWRYEVIPSTMASKIKTIGRMTVDPQGESGCKVTFEVTFDVKIFGVGSLIERFMASQFDENLTKQEQYTRSYIAGR